MSVMSEGKYRWFLSSSSAIFIFCVSIRALFSKTSFFRCSFSYRQHYKQKYQTTTDNNKQQITTTTITTTQNSCHATPTQLLSLDPSLLPWPFSYPLSHIKRLTWIILWILCNITAASMLGEGPRVAKAAPPGPSSRSLSN